MVLQQAGPEFISVQHRCLLSLQMLPGSPAADEGKLCLDSAGVNYFIRTLHRKLYEWLAMLLANLSIRLTLGGGAGLPKAL